MGQGIVIEMLMPIRPDADASIPQELLTSSMRMPPSVLRTAWYRLGSFNCGVVEDTGKV